MSELGSLVRAHLLGVDRRPHKPPADTSRCLELAFVADPSPARALGLAKGDLLVAVDGIPAADLPLDVLHEGVELELLAYAFARQEVVTARIGPIPLGARATPTLAAQRARNLAGDQDPLELAPLFEAGEFALLAELARNLAPRPGSLLPTWLRRWLARVPELRGREASVLHGAALYELGELEEGIRRVADFDPPAARPFFRAVARHYLGRIELDAELEATGRELLREAAHLHPSPRLAAHLTRLGLPPRPSAPEPFPRYELPRLDGSGHVRLDDALAGLDREARLIVVWLGAAPPGEAAPHLLEHLETLARTMPGRLGAVHFLSQGVRGATDPAVSARSAWLLADDEPLEETLAPGGPPWVYVLDPAGRVRHAGPFDPADFWQTLGPDPRDKGDLGG